MPKKQNESCDFSSELKQLKSNGPERLYFLFGPEDYLSTYFLETLRSICLPEGDDGFSLKRFEGPDLNLLSLESALNSMPFLSERILIELHNIDINKLSDPDAWIGLLEDIPAFCTVVFIQDFIYEPDGRLKLIKFLKSKGHALFFEAQDTAALVAWIRKRFAAYGKKIDGNTCEHLMFVSGTFMNRLIPEIDKIAGVVKGVTVTSEDIDDVVSKIPEADVFEMINALSSRNVDRAVGILSDLLFDKKTEPIAVVALIGMQIRRLYGVKLAMTNGLGYNGVAEILHTTWGKIINECITAAKGFSLEKLADSVRKCAEADYCMKSSAFDNTDLLKELLLSFV